MKNSYTDVLDSNEDAVELEILLPGHPTERRRLGPARTTPTRYQAVCNTLRTSLVHILHIQHVLHPRTYRANSTRRSSALGSPKYFATCLGITKRFPFWSRRPRLRPRMLILLAVVIIIWAPIVLLALVIAYGGVPPDYSAVRRWERELPQHVWTPSRVHAGSASRVTSRRSKEREEYKEKVADDGRRYLRFPDHLWGHGLNNVLQEALLTSHLSHRAQRSFVFEDFTWSHLPLPYTLYDFALRPTRVPLSAFVGGWVVGGGIGGLSEGQSVVGEHGSGEELGSTPMLRKGDGNDAVNHRDGILGSTSSVNLNTTSTSTTLLASTRIAIEERRAVSAEYFDYVCPPSRRVEIWYGREAQFEPSVHNPLSSQEDSGNVASEDISMPPRPGNEASGTEIVEWWVLRLQQPDVRDEPCVVVREEERRVFDSNFFGSTRILPLFDELKHSPVLLGFAWSPLVQDALDRTVARFFAVNDTRSEADIGNSVAHPSTLATPTPSSSSMASSVPAHPKFINTVTQASSQSSLSQTVPPLTIPGLLAVHLRRGDYKRHCLRLAEWRAGYMGFNRFESMFDTFDAEEHLRGYGNGTAATSGLEEMNSQDDESRRASLLEERREAYYLAHCLPTISEVVQRLHDVREDYQRSLHQRNEGSSKEYALQYVYVLTNGWPAFVEELRTALLVDGWSRVVGTPQLEDPEDVDSATSQAARGADQNVLATGPHTRWDAIDTPPAVGVGALTREEKGVSVAVDMGFAERAEVFVGNGFSSLSSNVVMLRMARGMPEYSSRLL